MGCTDEAKYQAIYVNYVSQYNINMTQFSPSNWTAYTSVNDFFIRPLQAGARPIAFADDDTSVASPADARVYGFQYIPAVRTHEDASRPRLSGPDGPAVFMAGRRSCSRTGPLSSRRRRSRWPR